jgi:hypothetical protein
MVTYKKIITYSVLYGTGTVIIRLNAILKSAILRGICVFRDSETVAFRDRPSGKSFIKMHNTGNKKLNFFSR